MATTKPSSLSSVSRRGRTIWWFFALLFVFATTFRFGEAATTYFSETFDGATDFLDARGVQSLFSSFFASPKRVQISSAPTYFLAR